MAYSPSRLLKPSQLRLVAAIADTGQLGLAADHVAISQPAASRGLSEIETLLGTRLFERSGKGMVPTLAGLAVSRRARDLLVQFQDLNREVAELKKGMAGSVHVGAVTGAAAAHVVPSVAQLKALSPSAEISIQVDPSDKLFEDFQAGRLDFILARLPEDAPKSSMDIRMAMQENLSLIVRSDHPLLGSSVVSLDELRHYPWVMQTRGMPLRQVVEASFDLAQIDQPRNITDTSSLLVMMAMLTSSLSIAAVAVEVANLLSDAKTGGKFSILPLDRDISISPYFLVAAKNRRLSPLANRMLELVSQSMKSKVALRPV